MKVPAFFLISLVILFPSALFAEDKQTETKPSTELEAFLGQTGSIIVKEFHDLGKVRGLYGTGLAVGTMVVHSAGPDGKKIKGLRIEVKGARPLERESTSFLDMDEIEALTNGLAYMQELAIKWVGKPREYTEVIFSTRGDLQVGFFITEGGTKFDAFAKAGRIGAVTAHLPMDAMGQLKEKVDIGLAYLEGL